MQKHKCRICVNYLCLIPLAVNPISQHKHKSNSGPVLREAVKIETVELVPEGPPIANPTIPQNCVPEFGIPFTISYRDIRNPVLKVPESSGGPPL